MNSRVAELIDTMGPATFTVDKFGMITSNEQYFEALKRKDFTMADFRALRKDCESCDEVGAAAGRRISVKYKNEKMNRIRVRGTTANIVNITEIEVSEGRTISEFEEEHSRQVTILGASVAEQLFPLGNALGKKIRIGGHKYSVIGLIKPRGAILGEDLDKFVMIPLTTLRKHFGTSRSLEIMVKAGSPETIQETINEVRMILRARRHVAYNDDDDFSIVTSDAIMDMYNQITSAVRVTAIAIPAIALVVAGIVVMNIMMVSVTERTREIGIRKSLGARRKFIMLQFVLEALLMSIAGGFVGIVLGLVSAKLLADAGGLPFVISPVAIGGGLVVSTGIGVIFGLYPAMKGSKLDPVVAMRYE
jgi:putative ABC transport system permease protein